MLSKTGATASAGTQPASGAKPLNEMPLADGTQKDVKKNLNDNPLAPRSIAIHFDEKAQLPQHQYVDYKEALQLAAMNGNYFEIESIIMIHLDSLDKVTSQIEVDPTLKTYPTGIAFVRDASKALPLSDRYSPNHPYVLADNMLLRALNTMRGIDHALKYKLQLETTNVHEKTILERERLVLQNKIKELINEIIKFHKKDYKGQRKLSSEETTAENAALTNLHTKFNSDLIQVLHNTRLDEGLTKPEDLENHLCYYRDLSSLLDPAKSMVTRIQTTHTDKTKQKNTVVTHTETAHPITVKTKKQIQQLDALTPKKTVAAQIATAAFLPLMKRDDRRLPAQTRKTLGPTIKNGYIVHNVISAGNGKRCEFISLRSGTPTCIGKDISEQQRAEYTEENLLQAQNAARAYTNNPKLTLHLTCLLTRLGGDSQDTMIGVTKTVRQKDSLKGRWSLVSINELGCGALLETSAALATRTTADDLLVAKPLLYHLGETFPHRKAKRIAKAGHIINVSSLDFIILANDDKNPLKKAAHKEIMINLAFCASGQDRTGTAMEVATLQWGMQAYQAIELAITAEQLETIRGLGCHNAVLASLATPGSIGLKTVSTPDNYFSPETTEFYYRKITANTNKDAPIDSVRVASILKQSLISITTAANVGDMKHVELKKQDMNWIQLRIAEILQYNKRKHKSDSETMQETARKIWTSKDSDEIKLQQIIAMLKTYWKKGFEDKIKNKNDKRDPGDQLIELLNDEHNDHSFYRNIGALLQNISEQFPDRQDCTPSETGHRLILSEHTTLIPNLVIDDLDNLTVMVNKVIHLAKNSEEKEEAENLRAMIAYFKEKTADNVYSYSHAYLEITSKLNAIWIAAAKKSNKGFLFQSDKPIAVQTEVLAAKLNNSKDENEFIRAIGTVLKTVQETHPNSMRIPIPKSLNDQPDIKHVATPPSKLTAAAK